MATLVQTLQESHNLEPAIIIPGTPPLIITHGRLHQQVVAFQAKLAILGIGPEDAVSISLPNSLEFVIAFLAVAWQQGIAAPLNPAYKEDEADFYVGDIGSAAIIVTEAVYQSGSAAVQAGRKHKAAIAVCKWEDNDVVFDVKEWGRLVGQGNRPLESPREEDDALILHTSGTTGRPKANICKTYDLSIKDRTMLIMPLFHVHGLLASFLAPLRAGSAIIIPTRLSPSFWKDFKEYGATWYSATPTMHKLILSFPSLPEKPAVRFIRSSSSTLSPQTLELLESRYDTMVLEAYAMTEASHQVTSNPRLPNKRKAGTVGVPQGVEVRILDSRDSMVPQGEVGEICIRGVSVTSGYLNNPEANEKSFTGDGFFRTGDQGRMDSEGYLSITGRIKELINKGGEKISPVELDTLIASHPYVADVVVFAIDDDMYGQEPAAAVILCEGAELKARELKKWLGERVAAYKLPKKIFFPAEIPKTATGKVQRALVAKQMIQETMKD